MELKIAIADDTLSDVFRLKSFVESWFAANEHKLGGVTAFASGEEMLKAFKPKMFQIVFMDIIMGSINGVETARILRDYDTELLIVFTTISREYAFDAFPVHPFDYIVKPYSKKDVDRVLDEALRVFAANDPAVTIKAGRSEHTIPLRLVSSVVSHNHNIEIKLTDGRCISSTMTFGQAQKLFADDPRFLLCNRGIIVNMSQISALENGVFIMKDGERYPLRVVGQSKIKAAFSQYLITNMRAGIKQERRSVLDG